MGLSGWVWVPIMLLPPCSCETFPFMQKKRIIPVCWVVRSSKRDGVQRAFTLCGSLVSAQHTDPEARRPQPRPGPRARPPRGGRGDASGSGAGSAPRPRWPDPLGLGGGGGNSARR